MYTMQTEKIHTLHEKLQEIANLYPRQLCVRSRQGDKVVELTYQEFYCQAVKIAHFLLSLPIRNNDKIAIALENCVEWGCIYFGILLSGAIAVPLDPQTNEHDLEFFCEETECKAAFVTSNLVKQMEHIAEVSHALTHIIFLTPQDNLTPHNNKKVSNHDDNNDICHEHTSPLSHKILQGTTHVTKPLIIIPFADIDAFVDKNNKNISVVFDPHVTNITEKTTENTTERIDDENRISRFPTRSPDDIASIIYTSGTTGRYKGVMLTHRNFFSNCLSITKLNFPIYQHNFLALLPLHHAFPFTVTLLLPLFTHSTVTYLGSLKSDALLRCLQQDDITLLIGVPQLFYMLHKSIATKLKTLPTLIRWMLFLLQETAWWLRKLTDVNLSKIIFLPVHRSLGKKLRFLLSGGAKLDDATALFFLKLGFDLLEGYGLTETAPVVTFNYNKLHKLSSVGKAIPDVTVAIAQQKATQLMLAQKNISENNEGNNEGNSAQKKITEREAQEIKNEENIGEIIIRGSNVMMGYYKHEAATHEVLKDGWLYSGDLGYLDNDGFLYITGRQKEIIVLSSGKNISPEEVETHYCNSRFIKEIGVVLGGIKPEEKLMAVIVPDLEYCQKLRKVDIYEVIKSELEFLSQQLAPHKRIMGFVLTKNALPRTRLGKLRRFLIQEQYAAEFNSNAAYRTKKNQEITLDANDTALLIQPLTQRIFNLINNITAQPQSTHINLDDHLEIDLGIESLARVELTALMEKELHIKIPHLVLTKIATVRELIAKTQELTELTQAEAEKFTASATPEITKTIKITGTAEISATTEPTLQTSSILQMPTAIKTLETAETTNKSFQQKNENNVWHEILLHDISAELKENVLLDFTKWQERAFICGDYFVKFLARIGWHLQVLGLENLPQNTACILCPNHTSFLDGPIIAAALPQQLHANTFFMGTHDIFGNVFLLRKARKIMKVISIDPGIELIAAMQTCAYVLSLNRSICIFPEGGRSANGQVKEFKKGVGILAAELNVPLIPIYISGTYESWSVGARLPKPHKVRVVIGKMYSAAALLNESESESENVASSNLHGDARYIAIANSLRKKVIALEKTLA